MSTPQYPTIYQCRLKLTAYDDLDALVDFAVVGSKNKLVITSVKLDGNMLLALKESEFAVQVSLSNIEYRAKLAYGCGDYYAKDANLPKHKSKRIVMLDIETLGVRAASSQILSIGAVDNFGEEFYHNISYKGNQQFWATRLTTEPETLNWWLNTAPLKAIESIRDSKYIYDVEDALVSFARYLQGADEIWCNGASFDFPKLDWHYAQLNLATPWSYKALRCYRTLAANANYPKHKVCAHNALQDAKDQLETLLEYTR